MINEMLMIRTNKLEYWWFIDTFKPIFFHSIPMLIVMFGNDSLVLLNVLIINIVHMQFWKINIDHLYSILFIMYQGFLIDNGFW